MILLLVEWDYDFVLPKISKWI